MNFTFNHNYRSKSLDDVAESQSAILRKLNTMSAELERLTREVAEQRTATGSLITLVSGLSDQIRDLKDDPAALAALADDLDAQQNEIAAAVSANTPAPPVG